MKKIVFLFAPGAGPGSSHPWMRHWKGLLSRIGSVRTLDYPYMRAGRMRPDPLPRLIDAHVAALRKIRRTPGARIVLIGKSMGSRVGCHVSLEEKVNFVVCLGYPLCGGGDRNKQRDEVLLAMRTPVLFIQGTRDPLCPLDLLAKVRRRMKAPSVLIKIPDGDHSLLVAKRRLKADQTTQVAVDGAMLASLANLSAPLSCGPGSGSYGLSGLKTG